jgi:hypothetical protein
LCYAFHILLDICQCGQELLAQLDAEIRRREDAERHVEEIQQSQRGKRHGRPSRRAIALPDRPGDNLDDEEGEDVEPRPTEKTLNALRFLGRKFAYNYTLWLTNEDQESTEFTFKKALPRNYNAGAEQRFESYKSIELGQVKDIIDLLGPRFSRYRQKDWIAAEVRTA